MALKGRVYLALEARGNKVVVTGHRTRPPEYDGVWVAVDLVVPNSVFAVYRAALELPEHDTSSVITIFPAAVGDDD